MEKAVMALAEAVEKMNNCEDGALWGAFLLNENWQYRIVIKSKGGHKIDNNARIRKMNEAPYTYAGNVIPPIE